MDLKELIRSQQGEEGTETWMIGEQLKDIALREPASAALLEKDLQVTGMRLSEAAKKLKAYADEKRAKRGKCNCVCVTPIEAEGVLRKFYGLPEAVEPVEKPAVNSSAAGSGYIDLGDYL